MKNYIKSLLYFVDDSKIDLYYNKLKSFLNFLKDNQPLRIPKLPKKEKITKTKIGQVVFIKGDYNKVYFRYRQNGRWYYIYKDGSSDSTLDISPHLIKSAYGIKIDSPNFNTMYKNLKAHVGDTPIETTSVHKID